MNATELPLDEMILENSIRIRRPDKGAQKIFARMSELNPENPRVTEFAKYLSYESIVNGFKPERGAIDVMEKLYLSKNIPVLAYALAHIYLNHGAVTLNSDEILRRAAARCETDGIIYPVFKLIKDKTILTPYIEKNRAFMYKSRAGRTAALYYKPSGTENFSRIEMKYAGFGVYLAHVTHFYGEKLVYYISEETAAGSVAGQEQTVENTRVHVLDDKDDAFYAINDALVFERMFKYDRVEEIITDRLKEFPRVKSWIM